MGLFDGISLKSFTRDVSNVVGAFTGARPIQPAQTGGTGGTVILPQPAQETDQFGRFLEYLPPILASIPRYEPPTQQEIILKLPEETKESGQMENGPQVYTGSAAILPFAQQAARTVGRTIFGAGGTAGAVGGAIAGYGVGQQMAGDACGCEPKPFVRLDKCGRPIITRAMQKKAKEMVQNCGIERAAEMLGVDIRLLGQIEFKQFKRRARGISGAQMKTATRVNNKVMHMAKKLEASCKRPAPRRR